MSLQMKEKKIKKSKNPIKKNLLEKTVEKCLPLKVGKFSHKELRKDLNKSLMEMDDPTTQESSSDEEATFLEANSGLTHLETLSLETALAQSVKENESLPEQDSLKRKRDVEVEVKMEEPKKQKVLEFSIRTLDTMTREDILNCTRIYGIAKTGEIYRFMVDEFNKMVEGTMKFFGKDELKLEDIAYKAEGRKNGRNWTSWKAKENEIFIRNTFKWEDEI